MYCMNGLKLSVNLLLINTTIPQQYVTSPLGIYVTCMVLCCKLSPKLRSVMFVDVEIMSVRTCTTF